MMMRSAAALTGLLACTTPVFAGVCQTTNLMPEVLAFRAATAGLPPDQRAARFVTEVAAKHPEFFKSDIFGNDDELRGYAMRLFDPDHPEHFGDYPPLTDAKLASFSADFPKAFDDAEKRFTKAFPDFACQTPILFGPSFGRFGGSGGIGPDGVYRMRFGIDKLAVIETPSDLPVLFSHEMFHVHHSQVLGNALKQNLGVVWWGAWVEGLASYVSYRITPGATPKQALAWPADLYERMQAPGAMKQASAQMLLDMDAKGKTYGLWFHMNESYPGLPSNAGYYMGYRMAEALAARYSLPELARMSPDELKPLIRAYLTEQSK
jgi:hypothetical protein